MGEAENKALVKRFYDEVWDRGNVDFAREVFHDDYIRHDLRPTQAAPGAAGMAAIAAGFRAAFPDARWHVDLMLAEGDLVAARWTATGTFTAPWGAVRADGYASGVLSASTCIASGTERSPRSGTTATTSGSCSRSARPYSPPRFRRSDPRPTDARSA